jgi:hypothetical protein
MDVLSIRSSFVTSDGIDDITRLVVSTQLKTIGFLMLLNDDMFDDEDATQRFVSVLQQQESTVQEMPGLDLDDFPGDEASHITTLNSIRNSLVRNQQLNRVNLLLLAPQPQQQPPPRPQPGSATTMMLKISHKVIATFAAVPNNAGLSAIFKLLRARPAIPLTTARAAAASVPTTTTTTTTTTPMRRLLSVASTSTAERASKRPRRHGTDVDLAGSLPATQANQALVDEAATTSPIATAAGASSSSSDALSLQEAQRHFDAAVRVMESLLERGDHEQAAILIQWHQEAGTRLHQLQRRYSSGGGC